MTTVILQTFCLDEETSRFLTQMKWECRVSRSKIIRHILRYFKDNPNKLKELLKNAKS
ncbi:MAG: hypothetical protein ACTSRH_04395 [Promethearchaeota archaeon]